MIRIEKEDFSNAQEDIKSKTRAREIYKNLAENQDEAFLFMLATLAVLSPAWCEGFLCGLLTIDNAIKRREVSELESILKKGGT